MKGKLSPGFFAVFSLSFFCLPLVPRTLLGFDCAALDSDDLLYLKEQMEAEEDAERLLRRTEKRAFAAFKISFNVCFCFWRKFDALMLDHLDW